MNPLRIVVTKMRGGYLKAILQDRNETIFGRASMNSPAN
jgi:hypothetical protein